MMKRVLFYSLLFLQMIILLIVFFQFENFDGTKGEEIALKGKVEFVYDVENGNQAYEVSYDLNRIEEEVWNITKDIPYNRRVYVTVERDTPLEKVTGVSLRKPKIDEEKEIVLQGKYQHQYTDGSYHVTYGFETLPLESEGSFYKEGEGLTVHLLLGKWGQYNVKSIEEVTKRP